MAARVNSAEVLAIMDNNLTDVDAFIAAATLIVDDKLIGKGLGDEQLKEIERWLSAHLTAVTSPIIKSEKIGSAAQVNSEGTFGLGLDFTAYGQQVKILDTTGTLVNIGKMKVTFKVDDFREAT